MKSLLTLSLAEWDPISKQPAFKSGAVSVTKLGYKAKVEGQADSTEDKVTAKECQTNAIQAAESKDAATSSVSDEDIKGRKRHIGSWLSDTIEGLDVLDDTFSRLLPKLASDSDAHRGLRALHLICGRMRKTLKPEIEKFGARKEDHSKQAIHVLHDSLFKFIDKGDAMLDVLSTLRALNVLLSHIEGCLVALVPVSQAIWDEEFFEAVQSANAQLSRMQSWVKLQMKVKAPQTLLVPSLASRD